jgi:zinc protease
LGNAFDYSGPMLWIVNLIHDSAVKPAEILSSLDSVMAGVQKDGVTQAQMERGLVKFRAGFYRELTQFGGFGKTNLLASLALFDDAPAYINRIEPELRKVTAPAIQKVAREYLRNTNRTILTVEVAQ